MKVLFIESSSKNCSVAISSDEEMLCLCEEVSENYKQSESLHVFVEWALEGAEISLKDLDAVCIGKGPGSYTGLRIGAASAKGFCFGLNIPLVAVNSLDSLAEPYLNNEFDIIIPIVDARRMEVYCKVLNKKGEVLEHTYSKIIDENSFLEYKDSNILFVGDGAQKAKDILNLPKASYESNKYPSAQYLIRKGIKALKNKNLEDIAYFEPFYLKPFHGVKKK